MHLPELISLEKLVFTSAITSKLFLLILIAQPKSVGQVLNQNGVLDLMTSSASHKSRRNIFTTKYVFETARFTFFGENIKQHAKSQIAFQIFCSKFTHFL